MRRPPWSVSCAALALAGGDKIAARFQIIKVELSVRVAQGRSLAFSLYRRKRIGLDPPNLDQSVSQWGFLGVDDPAADASVRGSIAFGTQAQDEFLGDLHIAIHSCPGGRETRMAGHQLRIVWGKK